MPGHVRTDGLFPGSRLIRRNRGLLARHPVHAPQTRLDPADCTPAQPERIPDQRLAAVNRHGNPVVRDQGLDLPPDPAVTVVLLGSAGPGPDSPPEHPGAAQRADESEAVYTIESHFEGKPDKVHEVFQAVREGIFALAREDGDIIETSNKLYIAYRHGRNFCELVVQAGGLKSYLDIPHSDLQEGPFGDGPKSKQDLR